MLKWIRGARLSFRTGIAIIVLALIVWGLMTWARIHDFVPEEIKKPHQEPGTPVRVP